MAFNVLKEPEQYTFQKFGIRGKAFPSWGLNSDVQFYIIDTDTGHETTVIEHESDFAFYILNGEGDFIIDDVTEHAVVGDLVVVSAGSKFTYKGQLRMFVTVNPPWLENQEEAIL